MKGKTAKGKGKKHENVGGRPQDLHREPLSDYVCLKLNEKNVSAAKNLCC